MKRFNIIKPILIAVALSVLTFAGFYYANVIYMPDVMGGTYIEGSRPQCGFGCFLAFDTREGKFYYTDSFNEIYIKGDFQKIADKNYSISCDDENNKDFIADQIIQHEKNSFLIIINGQERFFEKNSRTPAVIMDAPYR